MKIFINSNYEIKAINSTTDKTLMEIEVDRDLVFGGMSDFLILNYKYKPTDYGYTLTPAKDYNTLQLVNEVYEDNQELKEVAKQQDTLLLETDLRLMDLEFALEEIVSSEVIQLDLKPTYGSSYNLLARMILEGNYKSEEVMESNIQKYYDRGRLTEEEYVALNNLLYPNQRPNILPID